MNENQINSLLSILNLIIVITFSLFALIPLGGVIFQDLWNWFVAEAFDVSKVKYIHSVGMVILINTFFINHYISDEDKGLTEGAKLIKNIGKIVSRIITLLYSWLIGYLFYIILVA